MNPKPAAATPPATNDTFRIEEDSSSGRLHKRYADEFGVYRLTDERCNRAKSGAYVVLREVEAGRDKADFCMYDFPRDVSDSPVEVEPADEGDGAFTPEDGAVPEGDTTEGGSPIVS